MAATIRNVAEAAKVTDTTVSLAFQPGSRISDATRERVLAVAQKLGYVPNFAARQLRGGNTRCQVLALLVPEIANPFYALMADAAATATEARGFRLSLGTSRWSAEREVTAVEAMIQSRVDGVLACFREGPSTTQSLALLARARIPVVALDTCPEGYHGMAVLNDLEEAGRLAVAHLAEVGCRRIALVTADRERADHSAFRLLEAGARSALGGRAKERPSLQVIPAGLSAEAGSRAFAACQALAAPPDGAFCVTAALALGMLEAADAHGTRVGPDLAIACVDDLEACAMSRISLTAVRQPYEQLVAAAVDRLASAIGAPRAGGGRELLAPTLVRRRSTQR